MSVRRAGGGTMQRRTALEKLIALGAMTPGMDALGVANHSAMPEGAAWTPADYQLQFFTPAENQLLDQLTELIIRRTLIPWAHAAQVSLLPT